MNKIHVTSTRKTEVINVTEQLAALVNDMMAGTSALSGLAVFSSPHTTVALIVCEDDVELRDDIERTAESLFEPLRPFRHTRNNNPNAEAHLLSAFAGTTLCVMIEGGQPALGTYQNILLVELDGPKQREIRCMILSSRPSL